MKLSLVCWFKKTIPGNIFRGKYRLVKPVSKQAMETLAKEYQRQDNIMHLLRYPYLTAEESSGHTKALNKRQKLIEKWNDERLKTTMKPHVTIEERLKHLKIKEAWE